MSEETGKRTRTSTRAVVIGQVQALIKQHTDIILQAIFQTEKAGTDGTIRAMVHGHLASLSDEVADLASAPNSNVGGTHFVGETSEGKLVYVTRTRNNEFIYDTPGNDLGLVHVYGPWQTANGAKYAAANNTHTMFPQVF